MVTWEEIMVELEKILDDHSTIAYISGEGFEGNGWNVQGLDDMKVGPIDGHSDISLKDAMWNMVLDYRKKYLNEEINRENKSES